MEWVRKRGRAAPEMKWQFYYAADSLSLLPLNSNPCHCRSPFITITKTLQHLNLIHSPIPIPIPIHHHHHHPWILLPKVTGETLVFVSSILPKRSTISLSLSLSLLCTWVFICMCWINLQVFLFFSGLWQIFSASRLDIPSAWQMPQVIFFFLFWFYIEVL